VNAVRIESAWTCVSLNDRLESNKEEDEEEVTRQLATRSLLRADLLEGSTSEAYVPRGLARAE